MRAHPLGALITLLLASSMPVLAGALVAPSLPGIQAAFADVEGVALWSRLMLTMPALAVALIAVSAGWLVDTVGRRSTLLIGLVIYGVAGTTGLWLDSLGALIGGRLVLGLGVACIMTSATTLLADQAHGAARSRLMGLQAAFIGMGGLVFLLIGGALAELGWRWPFAVYGASWLIILPTLRWVPKDVPAPARARPPWGITPGLLARCAAATLSMVLFYIVPVQLPFLLKARFGAEGLVIGASIGLITLTGATGSLLFARIRAKLSHQAILTLTFALLAPGLLLVAMDLGWTGVVVGLLIMGAGMGLVMPNLTSWTADQAAPAQRGRHMGALTMALFTGQFASPLISQPLQRLGVDMVFYGGGALALAGAVACWILGARALRLGVQADT